MLDIRRPAPSGAAAGAEDLSTARGPVPNGGSNVSEEQNSRLYNEDHDYGYLIVNISGSLVVMFVISAPIQAGRVRQGGVLGFSWRSAPHTIR